MFLAPPSWEDLVARLTGRGTESPEVVERRLLTARAEMDLADTFDHVLVNHEVDSTADELAYPCWSGPISDGHRPALPRHF